MQARLSDFFKKDFCSLDLKAATKEGSIKIGSNAKIFAENNYGAAETANKQISFYKQFIGK